MLDGGAHRRRHATGKALERTFLGQHPQPARGGVAGRHDLLRVLVAQLVQREGALPGQRHGGGQSLGGVQGGEAGARAQMGFRIRLKAVAAGGHRPAQARGGEHVLQRLARAGVHQHVARGHHRQAGDLRHPGHGVLQHVVVRAEQPLQREERALRAEPGLEPHGVGEHGLEGLQRMRHQQRGAARQAGQRGRAGGLALDVGRMRQIGALARPPARQRDPVRQVAVAAARLRQQHQARRSLRGVGLQGSAFAGSRSLLSRRGFAAFLCRQAHLCPHDQVQADTLGLGVRPHHTRERTLVGEGQGRVTQRVGALHQLLRVRSAGEEAEVAAAVQLGVVGGHGHGTCKGSRILFFHTAFLSLTRQPAAALATQGTHARSL